MLYSVEIEHIGFSRETVDFYTSAQDLEENGKFSSLRRLFFISAPNGI
jgi:hypothetical protein